MRILFTGASSFTGSDFVLALHRAGHEVVCPLRGTPDTYSELRRRRVERLKPLGTLLPGAPFGSEAFLELLARGPWHLLCHHAAETTDYKNPDFDAVRALEHNTRQLAAVLADFKAAGGKAVVLTGSYFEADEGSGEPPVRAFSPYGLSKGLTWEVFRYYCGQAAVPLGKFVLPNPFGPWEEPRFTAYLMSNWRAGKTAVVKTPEYVRDNIHIDLLAAAYAQFAGRVATLAAGWLKSHPSGYAESQGAFAKRVAREVRARTDWPCALELMPQVDFSEPLARANLEPAAPMVPDWDERAAWDAFVSFYARGGG